ncbi:MAG: MFS transporter [Sphingomonas adhaesiva]|uniref:MFS transporter n=1 Tax=Sphingomonas adhaesiva TaxID=28212 RepID=UPI002FFC86A0
MLTMGAAPVDDTMAAGGGRSSLAVRTSALYAALYLHYGFFLLIPLWLSHEGATPSEIGTLMAIPLLLRLLTVAPFAAWAGRHGRVRTGIAATALAAAGLVALLSQADTAAQRFAIVVVFSIVWDQIPVLVDAYASMAVRARSLDFGRLRVWGSIGVVVSTAAAGWTVGRTGIGAVPLLIAGFLLLTPAVTLLLPGDRMLAATETEVRGGWRDLFADRALIGAMVAASFIMGSHGVVNSFGAIQWAANGVSTTQIGFLNAAAIASEILAFTLGGALLGKRDPRILILLAAAAAALRWSIMATDPALPVLYLAQCLQGLSSTGPLLAPMMMIARRVPAHLAASAQGLNAVFIGAVLAAVTASSGFIWSGGPGRAYAAMIVVSLLGLPLLFARGRRIAPAGHSAL